MKCTVCGSKMQARTSDLPFKTAERTIVILKDLPVIQCDNCGHYLIEDAVLERVDAILAEVDAATEVEIIHFAA
jgi:YgiT-type zinc finger domain-containing protein